MKKYAITSIAAAMLSAPAITATADPLYISLSGGLNLMSNSDAKVSDTETSIKNAVEYKRGYALEGAFGEKQVCSVEKSPLATNQVMSIRY